MLGIEPKDFIKNISGLTLVKLQDTKPTQQESVVFLYTNNNLKKENNPEKKKTLIYNNYNNKIKYSGNKLKQKGERSLL